MKVREIIERYPHENITALGNLAFGGIQMIWYRDFIRFGNGDCIRIPPGVNEFVDTLYRDYLNVGTKVQVFLCAKRDTIYWLDETEHWYLVTDINLKQVYALVRYVRNAVPKEFNVIHIPKHCSERYGVARKEDVYYDVMPLSKRNEDTSYFKFIFYECDNNDSYRCEEVAENFYRYRMFGLRYRQDEDGNLVTYN